MNTMDKPKAVRPEDFISEAAPGIVQHAVDAVDRKTKPSGGAYKSHQKVYPKEAHGFFRNIKWTVMAVALGIYYLLPWLRWDRGPGLPNQAFLLDFAHQRLFFGPVEIWAQEFYYITGILVVSALALFLVTAVAGRVWCGYACPQTVWTDLMVAVERFFQGDRNARIRLDQQSWTFEKIWKKGATHFVWLLIAFATGGALVFYFRDAPTLASELVHGTAPGVAYAFIFIFAAFTYLLGGIAREQVCIYMCPWPRIQGAMLDHDSLLVSYREGRGEPRGPHKKNQSWEGRGDCVDCKACVAVCPMGIDIRNGAQLECIQCALCIDACNEIMDKVGRPRDLIAYATFGNVDRKDVGPRDGWRIVRPRTVLYSSVIALISAAMVYVFWNRSDMQLSIMPDRNPLFTELSDGGVRNGFTLKVLNKLGNTRDVAVKMQGLTGGTATIVGEEAGDRPISVPADELRALRIYVTVPDAARKNLKGGSTPFSFTVTDQDGKVREISTVFRGPE